MTRTVTDAAIVLGVIAGYDPADPATAACLTPATASATTRGSSTREALKGARIAVPPFATRRHRRTTPSTCCAARAHTWNDPGARRHRRAGHPELRLQARSQRVPRDGCRRGPVHSLAESSRATSRFPGALKYGQDAGAVRRRRSTSRPAARTRRPTGRTTRAGLAASRAILDGVYNGRTASGTRTTTSMRCCNPGAGTPAERATRASSCPAASCRRRATSSIRARPAITFSGPAFSEPRLIALGVRIRTGDASSAAAGQHAAAADGYGEAAQEVGLGLPQDLRAGPV